MVHKQLNIRKRLNPIDETWSHWGSAGFTNRLDRL